MAVACVGVYAVLMQLVTVIPPLTCDFYRLSRGISSFEAAHGRYPTDLRELIEPPEADSSGWTGPYLEDPSLLDPWGNEIDYRVGPNGWELVSYGSDGEPGGHGKAGDHHFVLSRWSLTTPAFHCPAPTLHGDVTARPQLSARRRPH